MSRAYGPDDVTGAFTPATLPPLVVPYRTATAGAAIPADMIAVWKGDTVVDGDDFVRPLDGTVAHVQKFVGITNGVAVPMGGTVTYAPFGASLPDPLPGGLIVGDVWADDTGTLTNDFAATGAAASGLATRRVAAADPSPLDPTQPGLVVVEGETIVH